MGQSGSGARPIVQARGQRVGRMYRRTYSCRFDSGQCNPVPPPPRAPATRGDMREIPNETALPGPEVGQRRYLRAKSDPTVLICGTTGDCYTRRDGARWEYPGYKVDVDSNGGK